MEKLWCYQDAHHWGEGLYLLATKRGHDAHLFEDSRKPDSGFVFMHMHHHPQVRLLHKRTMAIMAVNPELTLIPDYRASVLYDDKLEQARQLSRWMPRTRVFYSPSPARAHLMKCEFPFISKTSEGASSHNVRFIETQDQAKNEIRLAFSDIGIKSHYGQQQRGYLLWQDFVAGNAGDVRVIAIGSKRLILRRGNRPDRPMASGSGRLDPVRGALDRDTELCLTAADNFFAAENMKWCGIDLVKDTQGKWYVLESTVGWTMHGYYECEFYDADHKPAGIMGDKVWDVLLDEIEAGAFANGS